MGAEVDIAVPARLIGEPARGAMLSALLSGEALTSGELARAARVGPSTASEHLGRLRDGGLVEVVAAGRHRYYRLASTEVAAALEALAMVSPQRPVRSLRQASMDAAMALARSCYDHLAGRVGVGVHDALVAAGALEAGPGGYLLTSAGERVLGELGVDVAGARASRRSFARACLDATERRPHLAGALGAALYRRVTELGWVVRRGSGQRALRLTDRGRLGFTAELGVVGVAAPDASAAGEQSVG